MVACNTATAASIDSLRSSRPRRAFVGMEPGPWGDGAELLYELMIHYTQPKFSYVHEWEAGDLIIYDNRTLVHAATWFDAEKHPRRMWRTTVSGNPGNEYAGEKKSWIPANA